MTNAVEHPAHYGGEDDPYEVIKVAEAWGFDKNAYLFNVLKYIRRDKGHTLEDLKKARFYLDRLIKRLEGTPIQVTEHKLIEVVLPVGYDEPGDPFRRYAIYARPDWTIAYLSSEAAVGAGLSHPDTYGIALSSETSTLAGTQKVEWLLHTWPNANYYLKRKKI